jgi:TPR repeat protein
MLLALVTVPTAAAELEKPVLSYEQTEEKAGFIALVRKARKGDAESQWLVGQTYARLGEPARALPVLQSAAATGHPRAASLLGSLYEEGVGTEKNRDEAMRWYRLAADQGQPEAMASLGRLLLQERGPEARESAWQWLRQAVRFNDRDGQYHLGWLLAQPGAAQDDAQAFQLFLKAADQGHVGAQVAVATHLLAGRGVAKDWKAASGWLARAAVTQDPVANYLLGRIQEDADGTGRTEAQKSYRIAATGGHREAQFALASVLAKSVDEADRKEAADWFAKAHEAGHKAAANSLGQLYRDGVGVAQQHDKAREYFQLAANRDNANAMYNLAEMLDQGRGGLRDTAKALDWYSQAADRGHKGALAVVARLLSNSAKTSAFGLKGFWQ